MPIIRMPDGTQVRFPDEMPREQIRDMIAKKFPEVAGGAAPAQASVSRETSPVTDVLRRAGGHIPFADELKAGAYALPALLTDETVSDRFQRYMTHDTSEQERIQREMPAALRVAADTAGLGASLAGGGAALKAAGLARPVATTGEAIGQGAASGGLYGAVAGAGEGEGLADRMAGAGQGATMGALLGGGVSGIASGVAGMLGRRAAVKASPEVAQLKTQADQIYGQARRSGKQISAQEYDRLADRLRQIADDAGSDDTILPTFTRAVQYIERQKGSPKTVMRMDQLRQFVRDQSAPEKATPNMRRIQREMVAAVDEAMDTAGDPGIRLGRQLVTRYKKAELIDDAIVRAVRRAESTGSSGNVDNAIRQNIRSILDNPKKARMFTAEEREAMGRVIRDGVGQRFLRLVGKLSPNGNGLMAMLHLIGAGASGGLTVPLAGVGMGAKAAADAMTRRGAAQLSASARSGGRLPVPVRRPSYAPTVIGLESGQVQR